MGASDQLGDEGAVLGQVHVQTGQIDPEETFWISKSIGSVGPCPDVDMTGRPFVGESPPPSEGCRGLITKCAGLAIPKGMREKKWDFPLSGRLVQLVLRVVEG